MLHLLHKCTRPGYPPDYLLSRIRGRAEVRVSGLFGVSTADSTFQVDDRFIWDVAAAERRWIYLQMDNGLRKVLAPLLFYFEVNTLIFCLRSIEAHSPDDILIDNLEKSLLAAELKKILLALVAPAETIAQLERFLGNSGIEMDGLAAAYGEGGVQKCEELIRQRFLEQVPFVCCHPELLDFFRRIIDLRNTMTLAKCVRWEKQNVPALIGGGHIRLRKADRVPSESGIVKMVRRFTGGAEITATELHPVDLEAQLNDHLSRTLARRMRGGCPVVVCMGHVWNCFSASRKRSRVYHAARFAEHFPGGGEVMQ